MRTTIRRQCRSRSLQSLNGGLETELESELELELESESVDILNIFSNYLFALASSCYRQQLQLQLLQLSPCCGSICIFAAWQQRRATPMPKGFREGFANGEVRGPKYMDWDWDWGWPECIGDT